MRATRAWFLLTVLATPKPRRKPEHLMHKVVLVLLSLMPSLASAGGPPTVRLPEPGTLELLGIGVVALVIAAIRSRRK